MSVLYVAEIGSNHKGIKSLAFEMIRQARIEGADIAKFQLGWPRPSEHRGIWLSKDEQAPSYQQQEMRYAPMKWVEELAAWCDTCGIEFMASIWSMEGLEAARSVGMKRYKVAKQKSDDKELIDEILKDGKQTFISCDERIPGPHAIYAVSEYPTPPSGLRMPKRFGEYFGEYFGYSSHSHGIGDALIAVARGAKYVEKHFTLDKTEHSIRDNHFALVPEEFRRMVEAGREMERFIGV
jgi:N,N'-diacetyllegionaminate synthase